MQELNTKTIKEILILNSSRGLVYFSLGAIPLFFHCNNSPLEYWFYQIYRAFLFSAHTCLTNQKISHFTGRKGAVVKGHLRSTPNRIYQ